MPLKENKQKLTIQTGLPHLVSTVAEIFDLENMEQDEGSGLKQNVEISCSGFPLSVFIYRFRN